MTKNGQERTLIMPDQAQLMQIKEKLAGNQLSFDKSILPDLEPSHDDPKLNLM
jgi:hypothetical protein